MGGKPCGCTRLHPGGPIYQDLRCPRSVFGFPFFRTYDAVASSSAPQELFSERHYADLDGGILEGFGRLLKFDLKIFVYPTINEKTGEMENVDSVKVAPSVQLLFDYIRQRGTLVPITNYNKCAFPHPYRRKTSSLKEVVFDYVRQRGSLVPITNYNRSPQSHLRESVMCGEGPCVKCV